MKRQEKFFQNKMNELKKEEETVKEMMNKKQEKEWANLKKDTKELVANKKKELDEIYAKMTSSKEKEIEHNSTLNNEKMYKELKKEFLSKFIASIIFTVESTELIFASSLF